MSRKPISEHQLQGICLACDKNLQQFAGNSKNGYRKYLKLCTTCTRKKYNLPIDTKKPYSKFKKDTCEKCGFVPEDDCQLDVHHIDCNHSNNNPDNLKTLCANCHRLEHKRN